MLAVFFIHFYKGDDTMTKKIGAIYIRVSTDKQEELSPDAQLRLLKEYAERNNIFIPNEFIFQDNGISGRKADKRPDFQKMIGLAKSKEHPIDCIIVWKFSRFARNQEESILYKSLLKKNSVDVLSISENTTGEFGTLIERIIEWMDEYYSIRLSGEVFRGMSESALRGNYLTRPPIGYLKGARKGEPPIIDEERKIIPLTMKKMFLEGKTARQICLYCLSQGWKTLNGNDYEPRDIEYILSNPCYAGIARWNYCYAGSRRQKPADEVIYAQGDWPALWTEDEWKEMSAIIATRKQQYADKKKPHDVESCKHWLSGIMKCSTCGRSLSYSSSGYGNFQCWGHLKGKCKTSNGISEKNATRYVLDGLKNLLNADEISYEVIRKISVDNSLQIEELNKQLSRITQREQRAKAAYLDGIDSKEEYKINKENFQKERSLITEKLIALTDSTNDTSKEELDSLIIKNISDVILVLENPDKDYQEKGNAIRSVVDHITYDKENLSFEFSLKLEL